MAGVAIGTVFRHFPTKEDLLRAMMKDLLDRLGQEAAALIDGGDPAALFTFFAHVVAQAAGKKTIAELLLGVETSGPVATLRDELEVMLARAKQAGAVAERIGVTEVMALLAATSDAALRAGWDPGLQQRTLAIIFNGLRPAAGP